MFALKWSSFIFLAAIALLGLPIRAESESTSEEIKPSSAKECRVHIEKALEQYWDQKEPSDTQISGSELNTHEQNEEDLEENALESEHNDGQELESFEDEEEVEETDEDKTSNEYDKNETSHDDDDDDEEEDEKEADGTKADEDQEEEEDEDDENEDELESLEKSAEEEEKKEVEEKSDVTTTSIKDNEEDDDLEDDDDVDEVVNEADDETETELTSEEQDQASKSDGIDKQNEAEYPENREVENEADEEDEKLEESKGEENEDDKEETDAGDEEETDDDDEEEIDEEDTEGDINEETENEEISPNENVEDNLKSDISPDEIQIEIQIESDKVTGEADSASARMAPEFLEEKPSSEQPPATQVEEKKLNLEDTDSGEGDEDESESEGKDDAIENIYEEEEDADSTTGVTYRSRDHIDVILEMDEIGTEYDKEEEKIAQNIFKEIKKIHQTQIKPMEMLYKYADSTTRILGDAEIFNKPMLIFLGPWSAGKTSIINYLLGIERTPAALKTGTGITDIDFTLITYGDQNRVISGTELAADWRYAGVQKFGQGFLDHFRCIQRQHTLLKKITIVDTPGVLENRKNAERGYSLNDAFQWFVDRSDAIYVVLDPTKVDIGGELGSVIDQLKGRDARFILNKADSIRRSDLMRVVGQLFWNLSPLMSSTEAPVIYAVSLTTKPYHPSAPAKFLTDQEKNFLYDMKDTFEKRVENRILYARRHAVRVRNHAKMVDCYLATYYRHKSIFSSKRNVAKLITENPRDYNIFDGLGGMTNVSRYDLPDPIAYKEFFKLHPLYDFKPLASTCSYFRGCPMEKLDLAISKDIPELLAKFKKMKLTDSLKQGR